MRGFSRAILAVVVLSLAASACGGGDGGSTEEIGKAAFVKRGDAICARAEARKNKALEAAFAKMPNPTKELDRAREEELVVSVALPPIEGMIEELGELPAPAAQEAQVEEMLGAYEDAAAEIGDDPATAIGGKQPFKSADRLAADLGFTACAEI